LKYSWAWRFNRPHYLARLWFTAFVLGAAQIVGAEVGRSSFQNDASVIPDTYGRIAHVVIQYDPDAGAALERTYRDLFRAMPTDVQFTILCPSAAATEEFECTWEGLLEGRTVRLVNVGIPISIWARDRCVFRQTLSLADRAESYVPVIDPTYEEQKINDLIAMEMLGRVSLIPSVLASPLQIEGGNVVSNRRHVFLGANIYEENESLTRSAVNSSVHEIFGRRPLILGDSNDAVPWCHIDMYVTPISDDTVMVASPRMAEMILETLLGEEGSESIVADTGIGECAADSLQERFDNVASSLERQGYRVIRLPCIVNEAENYMVTYNNVIMDTRNGQRAVFMPVYDQPCLDLAAEAIYHGLGFEVHTINVADVYTNGGAVRCLFNVAQRRSDDADCPDVARRRQIYEVDLPRWKQFGHLLEQSSRRLAQRRHTPPLERAGFTSDSPGTP